MTSSVQVYAAASADLIGRISAQGRLEQLVSKLGLRIAEHIGPVADGRVVDITSIWTKLVAGEIQFRAIRETVEVVRDAAHRCANELAAEFILNGQRGDSTLPPGGVRRPPSCWISRR